MSFEISEVESRLTPLRGGEVTYVPSASATVVALERQGGRVMEGRACVRSGSIVKETLKAGVLYFVLVFAAGFVLGTVRTLWAVLRLGVKTAELMEALIMLGVSILGPRNMPAFHHEPG